MTPKIFLVTAVAGAALVLAVPSAYGKVDPGKQPQWKQALEMRSEALNRRYGLGEHDPALRALKLRSEALNRMYSVGDSSTTVNRAIEARERSFTAGRDQQPMSAVDARERAFGEKRNVQLSTGTPPDVFERAVTARERGRSNDHFLAADDRFRIAPANVPTQTTVSRSGGEIEWPQVGIGLGIGIALALGLMLALRATRHRPLAH